MNFLPEKKYGVPSHNFVKKNVLCEKGAEITRFDGTYLIVFGICAIFFKEKQENKINLRD
jgi:hypothetical protein